VAGQAWSIHREDSVFREPEHFNPERWIEGAISTPSEPHSTGTQGDINDEAQKRSAETPTTSRMEAHMFPFAHGPRMCLGNNLVLIVLRIVQATITRNFHIFSPPETNEQTMGIQDANLLSPLEGNAS